MSINCARCHDHKVDPIPQRDYYRLLAVFHNVTHSNGNDLKKVKAADGSPIEVMSVAERGQAETHVLLRGNPSLHGDRVEPGVPRSPSGLVVRSNVPVSPPGPRRVADRPQQPPHGPRHGQPDLAVPLRPGIVPTPNEFGKLGEPATHPELLDWLASDLMDGGWTLKRMHRMIALSSVYRMSSQGSEPALARDPCQPLVLAISDAPAHRGGSSRFDPLSRGLLNLKAGGPQVYPPIPAKCWPANRFPDRAGRPRPRQSQPGVVSSST